MDNSSLRSTGVQIYDRWTALWNLELDLAPRILAPRIKLRYAQPGTEAFDDITRPMQLADQIRAWHQQRPGLKFSAEGAPVVDVRADADGHIEGLVARPYHITLPKADGASIMRSGTDILAISKGLIVEVWSVSGGLAGRAFYKT